VDDTSRDARVADDDADSIVSNDSEFDEDPFDDQSSDGVNEHDHHEWDLADNMNNLNGEDDENDDPNEADNPDSELNDDFLMFNIPDVSHAETDDNIMQEGIPTTNAGANVIDVEPYDRMDTVSGHVVLTQAAVCLQRYGKQIRGSQSERHFVQKLASTLPGEVSPLLYLESGLFPRIFYASLSSDKLAPLGALPLFAYNDCKHPFGLASIQDIARTRLISSSSLSSTCVHYLKFLFDVMSNKALSKGDSRQILSRDFQVDPKDPIGFNVRPGNSCMTDSIDTMQMTRNLLASQRYFHYDLFITTTCCQKDMPGTSHFHNWKSSSEWTHSIKDFDSYSEFEQLQFRISL
jgi:hypothetical protein